ncbi:MAG: hypothetical protein KJN90_14385 [Gammaproteobacteria bacterium]|nr:hypothetical protein [Gammaproteobacteria bacterium]
MRMKVPWIYLCLSLFPLLAYGGQEEAVPLHAIPQEIINIANQVQPEAVFDRAQIETEEDGIEVYEILGKLPDGMRVEVDILKNGDIQEYELEFSETQVPGAVLKAIQKKLPGFQPSYIEASHSASGKVTRYEFEGTLGDQSIDIEVSASGRKIEVADN